MARPNNVQLLCLSVAFFAMVSVWLVVLAANSTTCVIMLKFLRSTNSPKRRPGSYIEGQDFRNTWAVSTLLSRPKSRPIPCILLPSNPCDIDEGREGPTTLHCSCLYNRSRVQCEDLSPLISPTPFVSQPDLSHILRSVHQTTLRARQKSRRKIIGSYR
jgi:hypothetical protein